MKNLILFLLFPTFVFCKVDSLPPIELLHASIDSFYNSKIQAEILEFETPEALAWMKWMPSIGVAYTPSGQPRPSASWSTNIIYTARKEKDLRIAKIESIKLVNELARSADHEKLKTMIREYDFLIQDIAFGNQMIEIDRQLFDLMKRKFEAAEVDSRTWLTAQKDMKRKEYEVFVKQRDVLRMESEILGLSRFR